MRFFRSVPFSGASAIAICLYAAMGGFLFLNTLYLQNVRGLSPLEAGLYTLPMAGLMLVMAPLSGRFLGGHSPRLPLVGGSLALMAAALMLTQLTAHTSIAYLFGAYVLFGLGQGTLNPPITNTAVSGMPPSMAGVAAAIASTSRQTGMTLGVAVLGALAGGGVSGALGPSFAEHTHVSWWLAVGAGAIIFCLGWVTTSGWADRTARRAAESFTAPAREATDASIPEAELAAH